jgi:NAD(P)H dehydrogenase (quinone)
VKILIVVASSTGRTRRMAEAAAEGARESGAEVVTLDVERAGPDDVESADALLLASAVHMGGMTSSMRAFCERLAPLWLQGKLVGKVGAAMACGGSGGRGGAELALISMFSNMAEHGMLLVPTHNRLEGYSHAGTRWGPVVTANPPGGPPGPSEDELVLVRAHGRWVAECTARWVAGASS